MNDSHPDSLLSLYNSYNINIKKKPHHIAIIMDGNGRWASLQKKKRSRGHTAGVDSLKIAIQTAIEFGITNLSFWAFSTENWKRPKYEINFLFSLFGKIIKKEINTLMMHGIKVRFYGFLQSLPIKTQETLCFCEKKTSANNKIQVNIMINYGSKQEILHSIEHIIDKKLPVTEENLRKNMLTHDLPDPDILIRTSGELRISNFLLWQLAYTELFFLETLWPDFSRKDMISVLQEYSQRNRRFGGI
jgi:undecaprenyl diphosphate synthase